MKRSLLFLWLLTPFFLYAQSNFKKGYVLSNSGDTLRGYINYKDRVTNQSSVSFRTAPDAKTQLFNAENCSGYGIYQLHSFERYMVSISMGSINTATVKQGRDTSLRTDTVFLTVLQKGKNVTLYQYTDLLKTRFYLSERGSSKPYELERYVYLTPDTVQTDLISTDKVYSRQLLKVMYKLNAGLLKGEKLIPNLQYTAGDLLKLVSLINAQEATKSSVSHSRFFAGLALDQVSGFYKGDSYLANSSAISKKSYLPSVAVGVDLMANPEVGRVVFRIGLSFFMSKNEISTTSDDNAFARVNHVYNENTFAISGQFIYNFYNTATLKIFGAAGFAANISAYSNNEVTRYNSVNQETLSAPVQVKFDSFSPSLPISAGLVIHRKIEISATFVPATTISRYEEFRVLRRRSEVGVKYLFGGH